MRKLLFSIVAAGSVLSLAAPAAAQWAPPVYHYSPYNYTRSFSGFGFGRAMQSRVQRIRTDIRAMQMRRILSYSEARSLDIEARQLERRIYRASRNGISPNEARTVENRIRRLEYRVAREARDWDGRPGRNRRY